MATWALPWNTWRNQPHKQDRLLWATILLAGLSLFLTLWVPLSGEEGNYTMTAMEMYQSGHWFTNLALGTVYPRPPLMKFMVMCVATLIGFKHVLLASRLVVAFASLGCALLTYLLSQQLTTNRRFALWATAIYLSGDLLFRRGWLAYSDPVFAFFIMASMAAVWLACEKRSHGLLLLGCISVVLGFLTKEPRAYTFYGSMVFVLLCLHRHRSFLWSWPSWLIHAAMVTAPVAYSTWFNPGYLQAILSQIGSTDTNTWGNYLYDVLFYSPTMLVVHLLPISVVSLWVFAKRGRSLLRLDFSRVTTIALVVSLINWLPCWLAWGHWPAARYYMPIYPLLAMVMAYVIFHANQKQQHLSFISLVVMLLLKYTTAPWLFTYLQDHYHNMSNMKNMSQQMLDMSRGRAVYIQKATAIAAEQHVVHTINVLRWPAPTILYEDYAKEKTYNVITLYPRKEDKLIHKWPYHHFAWYLMCHGPQCRKNETA